MVRLGCEPAQTISIWPDPRVPHPANGEKQLLLNSELEDLEKVHTSLLWLT